MKRIASSKNYVECFGEFGKRCKEAGCSNPELFGCLIREVIEGNMAPYGHTFHENDLGQLVFTRSGSYEIRMTYLKGMQSLRLSLLSSRSGINDAFMVCPLY
jgi:hypothetical protein